MIRGGLPGLKIMVPVNGERCTEDAFRLACSIASERDRIIALYVVVVDRSLPLDAEIEAEMKKAEEVLSEVQIRAGEAREKVSTGILQARDAGPALVKEAVEQGVDLLILGMDYKKEYGEFTLGHTVPYILKHAPCRVWLCRETIPGNEKYL